MSKTEFLRGLIGEEVAFTVPSFFGLCDVGVVESVDGGIVVIGGEPYSVDEVEVE